MKLPNINCTHYDSYGNCLHPGKDKIFYFFAPHCILTDSVGGTQCMLQEKYDRPHPHHPKKSKKEIK